MKTKILTLVTLAFLGLSTANAQVGIGTENPHPSAILEVDVTSLTDKKGFLPPRMDNAERDAISSPAPGLTIYNTDANCLQWWNNSYWFDVCGNTPIAGTGGDNVYTTEINNILYRVHVFENSGTFDVIYEGDLPNGEIDYLIVAGGGSGGIAGAHGGGGGGGAGGVIENSTIASVGSYNITIGQGGASVSNNHTPGNNGGDSEAFGETAIGGGAGGSGNQGQATSGGSGGGAGTISTSENGVGATGTTGQGNDGANALAPNGGGGGGAGTAGNSPADISTAATGGDGLSSAITGTPTFYAGGGAGSGPTDSGAGATAISPAIGVGGSGGGGGLGSVDGEDGKGGGGAGGLTNGTPSGRGGNGIVIIRYPLTFP